MEEPLWCGQEPQAKVPLHCQSLQAWRGCRYAPHQSGILSNSLHLVFILLFENLNIGLDVEFAFGLSFWRGQWVLNLVPSPNSLDILQD